MYYKNIVRYDYDTLGRVNSKTMHTGLFSYKSDYTYVSGISANSTTSKVASIKNNNGVPITYEYDANGNITKITQGLVSITYYYNELNELIQEDNQVLNKTIIYSYDEGGNLISKLDIPNEVVDSTAIAYEYDSIWKDKLLKYNGKSITYDAIGNPLSYDGYTYTWEEGRQLKTIVGNGKNISYKYNDAGIRTEQNVDGVVTKYTLLGNRVTYETNGTDVTYYTYDSQDDLVSMNLSGVEYYYIRNAQGDIIGLFDGTGIQVVSYVYDSWGRVVSTTGTLGATLGVKNPYRYRGYRYDTETGLYYLNSRYYNPEWGKFINADIFGGQIGTLLSHNVFAYTMNNPVNMEDPSGSFGIRNAWSKIKSAFSTAINVLSKVKDYAVNHSKTISNTISNASLANDVASSISAKGSYDRPELFGKNKGRVRIRSNGQTNKWVDHNVIGHTTNAIKSIGKSTLVITALTSATTNYLENGGQINSRFWLGTGFDVSATLAVGIVSTAFTVGVIASLSIMAPASVVGGLILFESYGLSKIIEQYDVKDKFLSNF